MVVHPNGQKSSSVPPTDAGVTASPQEEGSVFFLSRAPVTIIRAVYLIYSRYEKNKSLLDCMTKHQFICRFYAFL